MCHLIQKFPVFPQLDWWWTICLLVYMVVVKPLIELTLADEDEPSAKVKQLQRDKLTLNNSSMNNCFNRIALSCSELSVLSVITQLPTHFRRFLLDTDSGNPRGMIRDQCNWWNILLAAVFIRILCVLSFLQGAACSAYRVNRKMPVPPPPPPPGPPPPPTLAFVSGCELTNCIITVFPPFWFSPLGSD